MRVSFEVTKKFMSSSGCYLDFPCISHHIFATHAKSQNGVDSYGKLNPYVKPMMKEDVMKKKFLMFLLSSVLMAGTLSGTSLAEDITTVTEDTTAETEDVVAESEDITTEAENISTETEDMTAESGSGHTHYLCGETHQTIGDHTKDTEVDFTPWTSTDSLPDAAGNYYLTDNVTLTKAVEYNTDRSNGYCGWDVPDGVVLCLNGHNITMQNPQDFSKDVDVIKVSGHFTLTDCKSGQDQGKITHANDVSGTKYTGKGVMVLGGTFDMYRGIITGNASLYDTGGSGVCVKGVSDTSKATLFNLYGGQITGNTAKSGGGVNVSRVVWYGTSEFRMHGGSITNNVADSDWSSYGTGGGVYVSWTAKFVMNGGTISGNTASQFGGGVYASALAANNAYDYGGAATLEFSSTASIINNHVAGKTNNICLDGDVSNYQTVESRIALTGALNGTIGVNTIIAPTASAPVVIATGAGKGTNYSKNLLSDDAQYLIRQEGSNLLLTTEGYSHTHTWGEWQHDNNQHWQVCEGCDEESSHQDHNWDNGVITKEPTTTTAGEKTFTCEVCKATRVESISPLPADSSHTHSYGTEWKSDKINHWHECTCGDKTDLSAHTFKWVVDKEATATEKGSKHQECSVCGYKESPVEIAANGTVNNNTDKKNNDTTGTASKSDKSNNKSSKSDEKKAPKSGDANTMTLWFALLVIGGGAVGATVVKRKRQGMR